MRCPSTFCWPTHAMICEMLMDDPLEPDVTVALKLFSVVSDLTDSLPALSRASFKQILTWSSKLSCMVRPGCTWSTPRWPSLTSEDTFSLAASRMSRTLASVLSSAMVSPTPTVKPKCRMKWLLIFWIWFMSTRVTSGPNSLKHTWIKPPALAPSVLLSMMPVITWPSWMSTEVSSGLRSRGKRSLLSWPFALACRLIPGGMMVEKICLPVQSAWYWPGLFLFGTMIAGMGMRPSKSSTHMRML
mmetsp:Transcript_26014/g.73792  ORF Transcript_26014/g.73792 Transcript_26014/m.73792 type:complete len:244 (+) Transcript_26014:2314-3045(+)